MRLPLWTAERTGFVLLTLLLASDANAGSGMNSGVYNTSMMAVQRERQRKEIADYESARNSQKRPARDSRPFPDRHNQNQTRPLMNSN